MPGNAEIAPAMPGFDSIFSLSLGGLIASRKFISFNGIPGRFECESKFAFSLNLVNSFQKFGIVLVKT